MIESSRFGAMTVDGRTYTSDLFIYPDGRVEDNWWRRQGHVMTVDDILPLVDACPGLVIVGTGTSGRMRPERNVAPFLSERGIGWIVQPTAEAAATYNREIGTGIEVAACFHLTC
jgi:hypothetical protein